MYLCQYPKSKIRQSIYNFFKFCRQNRPISVFCETPNCSTAGFQNVWFEKLLKSMFHYFVSLTLQFLGIVYNVAVSLYSRPTFYISTHQVPKYYLLGISTISLKRNAYLLRWCSKNFNYCSDCMYYKCYNSLYWLCIIIDIITSLLLLLCVQINPMFILIMYWPAADVSSWNLI